MLAVLRPATPVSVMLVVGGSAYMVETSARTVGELLQERAVVLGENDGVSPDPTARLSADMTVRVDRARAVTLTVDGQSRTFLTRFSNPLDILNSADVELEDKDEVVVDGTSATIMNLLVWPVPATSITIRRAITISLEDGGRTQTLRTASRTVGEALFEANVTLYLADEVSPDVSAVLIPNMTITIQRSRPISIAVDGVTLETRTQGETVSAALTSAGVTLLGLDYAIPSEDSPLQPGMTIRVIRVTEQVEQEQQVIPFETLYQADAELELDQRLIAQEGRNGILQRNVRIRFENGSEVNRTPESETVAVTPVNRIVSYGTRIVLRTVDTPEGPKDYWRRIRMYATSYHPAALGGDNITATGRVLTKGIVGIDPKIIPYGTQLYVPGYGIGVAADTGGPRRIKLWIDLGYDDENWISWSKYVDVYLLTPVPERIVYLLPG